MAEKESRTDPTTLSSNERKLVEEALQASEQKYRYLFDEMVSGSALHEMVYDENGIPVDYITLDANKAYEKLLGVSKETVIGKKAYETVPSLDRDWLDIFGRVALTGEVYPYVQYASNLDKWFEGVAFRPQTGQVAVTFKDITEYKQTENALRQANERLTLAQRAAGAGVWDWDIPTGQLNWSPELFRLFGLEPTDASPTFDLWRAVLHPQDRKIAEDRITEAIRDHRPLDSQYRIVLPGGEVRWIHALGDTTYDEHGDARRMSGICIDITRHKETEEALRQSEERHRLISNLTSDYVYSGIVFPNGAARTDWISGAFEQITGYTVEEIKTMPLGFASLLAPEDIEKVVSQQHLLFDHKPLKVEYRIRRKDGEICWLLDHMTPASYDTAMEGVRILGAVQDITERKRAEESIRRAEKRSNVLIENASDCIVLVSVEGKFKYASPSTYRVMGYNPDDVDRLSPMDLTHPDDLPIVLAVLSELIQNPAYVPTIQYRFRHHDGRWLWIESTFSNLIAESSVEAIVINFRNINERRHAEEKIQNSEAFLNRMIEQSPLATWVSDDQGTLIRLNQACCELLNITPDEVIGKYNVCRDSIVIEQGFLPQVKAVFERGQTAHFEVRYDSSQLKDLELRQTVTVILDVTIFPIKDTNGRITHAVIQHNNITDRKRAEAALRESENILRVWLNAVEESAILVDREGIVLAANATVAQRLHISVEELIGACVYDLIPPETAVSRRLHLTRVIESGQPARFEDERFGRVIDNLIYPVFDQAGQVKYLAILGNDTTDHKQTETALRETKELYQALFDQSADAVFLFDLEGRYVDANQRATELLGYSREEILGFTINDISAEVDESHEVMQRLIAGETIPAYERLLRRKDGALIYVEPHITLIRDHEGRPYRMQSIVRDITERKRAEKALSESEARYRLLAANISDVIWILDMQASRFLYVSPSVEQLRGYSVDEVMAEGMPASLAPASAQYLERILPARLADFHQGILKVYVDEIEQPCKDGSTVWTETTTRYFISAETGHLEVYGVSRNINERKQAEKALRESEEKFRKAFMTSPDSININRLHDGVYVSINQGFTQIMGYTEADVIGKASLDLQIWDNPEDRIRLVDGLRKYGVVSNLDARFRRKDGGIRYGLMSASVIELDGIPHILSITRDITKRKQAEKELRFKDDLLRMTSEMAKIGGWEFDVPSLEGQWTDEVARIHDLDPAVPTNAGLGVSFYLADSRRKIEQAIKAAIETAQSYDLELQLVSAKGNQKWVRTMGLPIVEDGKVIKVQGIFQDITERKSAEQALQEYSDRLEVDVAERTRELREAQEKLVRQEKLAVLGQLAGGVGHELRNPLAVINNAVYFLKLVQPDADEKIKDYLGMIEKETHTAEKIISDLLDFARIKSVDRERVAVSELIQRVLERYPAPSSVEVTLDLPPDLPLVFADPRQVEQVLGNLVVNAYQAMLEGGQLSVVSDQLSAISDQLSVNGDLQMTDGRSRMAGNGVLIAVKDTGAGITPENMSKLFEPLFTTKLKGIGLGLAVSRKLIEANGGYIEAQSELGKGSTFTVWLPVKQ